MKHAASLDVISLFLSSSAINVNPASDVTGSPSKLTIAGHDFTCSNMNCSGIQSFLFGVILQTAGIVVQYTFWQFLTPISSGFVRNPGNKRRKEEAVKVAQLKSSYGNDIRFILFLCGYFDSGYLGYEAAEGIDWVWEHRVDDLALFGI